ncbi:unnamed protein product [Gordionus sp. m RMFG-2023]
MYSLNIVAISTNKSVIVGVACENQIFLANCHSDHVIHIVNAVFGRFSLTPCGSDLEEENNILAIDQMDLQCSASNSTDFVKKRCDNRHECMLEASIQNFGDPCIGTPKYLEIQYYCDIKRTTMISSNIEDEYEESGNININMFTNSLDYKIANISNMNTHITNLYENRTITLFSTKSYKDLYKLQPILLQNKSMAISDISFSQTTYIQNTTLKQNKSSKSSHHSVNCASKYVRDILWPQTEVGMSIQQKCPFNAYGFAHWFCGSKGNWFPENPDLSECSSQWSLDLENEYLSRKTLSTDLASKISVLSHNKIEILGGDLKRLIKLIGHLSNDQMQKYQYVEANILFQYRNDSKTIAKDLLNSSNVILSSAYLSTWTDLPYYERKSSATILLRNIENIGHLLGSLVTNNSKSPNVQQNLVYYSFENIVMKTIDETMLYDRKLGVFKNITFQPFSKLYHNEINEGISFTENALHIINRSQKEYFTLTLLNGNIINILNENTPQYETNSNFNQPRLASKIISIIKSLPKHLTQANAYNATKPLMYMTFPLANFFYNDKFNPNFNTINSYQFKPHCMFLEYNNNDFQGNWSSKGCWLVEYNKIYVKCACDHLTNFAVLLDIVGIEVPLKHEIMLVIITQIGCIVSILCLLMCIVTFQYFKKILNERMNIHKHLCVCLLVAEIIFVFGIRATSNKIGCSIIAGFLHYFFLSAFMWMLLEGVQLYTMLVEVFESEKSKTRYYVIIAYGIPFIIVLISVFINPHGYGTKKYCWLTVQNFFIFSFVGPIVMILVANFIFLGIALYIMGQHYSRMPNHIDKTKLNIIKTWFKGALILIFLMGLTWIFGLFFLNKETLFAAYIFTILNSFQGLFIFLFHCLFNEKIMKEYQRIIFKTPYIPNCFKIYFNHAKSVSNSTSANHYPSNASFNKNTDGCLKKNSKHLKNMDIATYKENENTIKKFFRLLKEKNYNHDSSIADTILCPLSDIEYEQNPINIRLSDASEIGISPTENDLPLSSSFLCLGNFGKAIKISTSLYGHHDYLTRPNHDIEKSDSSYNHFILDHNNNNLYSLHLDNQNKESQNYQVPTLAHNPIAEINKEDAIEKDIIPTKISYTPSEINNFSFPVTNLDDYSPTDTSSTYSDQNVVLNCDISLRGSQMIDDNTSLNNIRISKNISDHHFFNSSIIKSLSADDTLFKHYKNKISNWKDINVYFSLKGKTLKSYNDIEDCHKFSF